MTALGNGVPLSFFQIDVADFVVDPYPVYRQLREHAPRLVTPDDLLVLSRHRDCCTVLRDHRWDVAASYSCTSRQGVETESDTFAGLRDIFAPGGTDTGSGGDDLRRLRLIGKAFTRRAAMSFAGPMQELVDRLIDDALAAGRVDLVDAFARPVVDTFFCQLLGVPYTDRVLFHRWAFDLTRAVDPASTLTDDDIARIQRSGAELREYVRELVTHRPTTDATDLFSMLATEASAEGDPVSEQELVATCSMLLIAGSTSVDFLSLAAKALVDHPEQRTALAGDPDIVPPAVEELLRYTSPIQFTIRVARVDHDLDGHPVRSGQQAIMLLAAANRDPDVYPEPDLLNFDRRGEPHLAFSQGRHHCLGAQFARVQGQIALSTLARRVPELSADGDVEYKKSFVSRSLSSLPVTLGRLAVP
jgi:cytochrome P450